MEFWKEKENNLISYRICLKLEEEKLLLFSALMIISESPSQITWAKFSSCAKHIAFRAANTSTISTKVGSGIDCEKAAITRPLSLQIIAPRPARLLSANVAPSKLILTKSLGGGFHLYWRGTDFRNLFDKLWPLEFLRILHGRGTDSIKRHCWFTHS